jgi:hypothetical protein
MVMPTHFHSFSDWRTSAYIYSIALFQRLGVAPELSVRLPSAIFGIVSVLIIYVITNSYIAAFILSISPWAIHYSRTGFEVSGIVTVILLGIYFFQKFSRSKRRIYLFLSLIFLCLSPYFYSTAKIFLPIIFLIITLVWRKEIFSLRPREIIFFIGFAALLLSPMFIDTIRGRSGFRFSYIGIFTEPHREQVTDQLRYEDILLDHPNEIGIKTPFLSYLLHNKYQLVVQRFVNNYFSSYSTDFLFLSGDSNIRHGFGGYGLLYLLDAIFILFGLYQYFRSPTNIGKLFLWLLILAPIPFSLTRDSLSPHSTRLILMLPSFIYFISLGIGKRYFLLPLYLLFFLNFWHYYTIHYTQTSAVVWHSGMKQSVLLSNDYPEKNIYFSDTYEPFLPFFLFYHPYFPTNGLPLSQNITRTQNGYFDGQVLNGSITSVISIGLRYLLIRVQFT